MTPIEKAKSMLPNMPEEVFNLWLAPLIQGDGWPFNSIYSSTHHTIWYRYLLGYPIRMFHDLGWNHETISCLSATFHKESLDTLGLLVATYMKGLPTIAAKLKAGKGKDIFFAMREFIERTRRIPTPIVLITYRGKYHLMDGNHRIAALLSLGLDGLPIDAWIGN